MHRPTRGLLAALVLALGLAGCGGGGGTSTADVKARLADQIEESGLEREAAVCFAGVIVDEVGADKVKDVDFSADEPPAELQDDFASAAAKALSTCKIDTGSLDG